MADVVILKAAADDYTAALRWYAERSIAAAAGFETAISFMKKPGRAPCDARPGRESVAEAE